jgi:hypothetical protein
MSLLLIWKWTREGKVKNIILEVKWFVVTGRICAQYKYRRYSLASAMNVGNFYIRLIYDIRSFCIRHQRSYVSIYRRVLFVNCDYSVSHCIISNVLRWRRYDNSVVVEASLYFYVGSTFTFFSRQRHGSWVVCLVVLRVLLLLIRCCHSVFGSYCHMSTCTRWLQWQLCSCLLQNCQTYFRC